MISIGVKIKELMSKEKLDTPTLAIRLNKSKQAVYDIIDKQDLNTSILRELAVIFHVPVTYFLTEDNANLDTGQEYIESLKKEIESLKEEIRRLNELKLPKRNDKALDVSMKFFDAAKEMFVYYNQMKEE